MQLVLDANLLVQDANNLLVLREMPVCYGAYIQLEIMQNMQNMQTIHNMQT